MPRPNKARQPLGEENLALRIVAERESRGWSYEGLADRMTKAGCPLNASAIYKIEKGSPRRRIVLDEAVAFSRVFGVPLEELVVAPEMLAASVIYEKFKAWTRAEADAFSANRHLAERRNDLRTAVAEIPDAQRLVEEFVAQWATSELRDPGLARIEIANVMYDFTGDHSWDELADKATLEWRDARQAKREGTESDG